MEHKPTISSTRLSVGGIVIVVGFMSPLLIPLVASTGWSIGLKGAISGLLALGIPEVFMIIGIAILGKDGYQFLKEKLFGILKKYAPPDYVSPLRYRIGLVMFCLPLFMGWLKPYMAFWVPGMEEIPLWTYIIGDALLLSSFFVLGGNFWDKLGGLFKYNAQIKVESTPRLKS